MTRFVLATRNRDKATEITDIFAAQSDVEYSYRPLVALDGVVIGFCCAPSAHLSDFAASVRRPNSAPDVEETATTLAGNARIKARGVADALGVAVIADDTGLEVDALGGEPGVKSARYAGSHATYSDNCAKLLSEMGERLRASRTARFVTATLYCGPGGENEVLVFGKVEGVIADSPRGSHGFGYDPIFIPAGGGGLSFGEMNPDEKHALSHRGRAMRELAAVLSQRTTSNA